MSKKFFITGTDTEIGKTYVSQKLLQQYQSQGYETVGLKPVASGCTKKNGQLYNEDALILQNAATHKLPYSAINPFTFESPIAPHIAAKQINQTLCAKEVAHQCEKQFLHPADIFIIEGFGGWLAPLNESESMADVVKLLDLEVILVVGMKLGCLNHALLTAKCFELHNIRVKGWIANHIDPKMLTQQENIETLKSCLPFPLIATMHYQPESIIPIAGIAMPT